MLLLVTFIGAMLPLPVRSSRSINSKDHSRPFPCQDRPCGCRSAEQCKKKCCCFSAEQKLAWAKRNRVAASEVVASTENCETKPLSTRKGCCSANRKAKTDDSDRFKKSPDETMRDDHIVIGMIAQECQGVAQTLSGQPVFVIPPVISLSSVVEPTGQYFVLEKSLFVQRFIEPPVPPPRLETGRFLSTNEFVC